MLGKTLILGLISAGAAGAIVYYGTAPQGSEAGEVHPHNIETSEKPNLKMAERKAISPRLPTIRKGDDSEDGRKDLDADLPINAKAKTDTASVAQAGENDVETAAPKKQTRWLDQYLKKNKGEDTQELDKEKDVTGQRVEIYEEAQAPSGTGGSDSATNSYTVAEKAAINDIEPESMPPSEGQAEATVIDRRVFRIENGELVEIQPNEAAIEPPADTEDMAQPDKAQTDKAQRPSERTDRVNQLQKPERNINMMANDSTPLLSTVMNEAAEIKKTELRDQAYFEITEYALSEGRFDSARMAHDMIEQDELAYTAKSRIAVAYAQNGKPSKAFKVISEVDETELRDFMRLQVIEALVAPERLPQSWRNSPGPAGSAPNGAPYN